MSLSEKLRQVRMVDDEGAEARCSQDILCSPDFITPVEQQFSLDFSGHKENAEGPEPLRSKRPRQDGNEKRLDDCVDDSSGFASTRQRALSPPCIRNPFASQLDVPSSLYRKGSRGHVLGASDCSRYHDEFHEMEEIGRGNFSRVHKALKRIDGCLYAVKRSRQPLVLDGERRRALREVQALACLGTHENVVRYFSSWFEDDYLYIQMELCDSTLGKQTSSFTENVLLKAMWQSLNALTHIHSLGVVHLDLKPDNIYCRAGVYKIGDFGSAARIDGSISVDEGDARYLPLEMLNDDHSELEKADMFSLGATFYELARGSPLTSSGSQFRALRQGKLALLPNFSLAFQTLLRGLMHPDPKLRPAAAEARQNPIFKHLA